MLFADSGAFGGSTCFAVFLILAVLGWSMNQKQKEKERKAEALRQMQMYGQPAPPSLTKKLLLGVGTHLVAGIVKGFLGHRHHGHHNRHGW